jgi:hypothetical protein
MSSSPSLGRQVSESTIPGSLIARRSSSKSSADGVEGAKKLAGYGLPCAKCRTYYPADLKSCPVCKTSERVEATATAAAPAVAPATEPSPDPAMLEQERERFLREFQAQMGNARMPSASGVPAKCLRAENHTADEPGSAVVCQDCYEQLQERVDVLEAALHIELQEAAQIVYDAVWADPSDPSKTYENAAHALLTELRKRSGVVPTFSNLQPSWHASVADGD